jgi:hypothetical protein
MLDRFSSTRGTPSRVLGAFVSELLQAEEKNMLDAEQAILKFKEEHNIGFQTRRLWRCKT